MVLKMFYKTAGFSTNSMISFFEVSQNVVEHFFGNNSDLFHFSRLSCLMLLAEVSKALYFTNSHKKKSGGAKLRDQAGHSLGTYLPIQEFRNKSFKREGTSRVV